MLRLKSKQSNKAYELDKVEFIEDKEGNYFLLTSSDNGSISYTIDYILPVYRAYEIADIHCSPFTSKVFNKENDIYEVFVKAKKKKQFRIGWIFTIQSLISNEHSQAGNIHFLRYAFTTFQKLLQGQLFPTIEISLDHIGASGKITLEDLYPSGLVVLATSKIATESIHEFEVYKFLQSFYNQHYYYCSDATELEQSNTSKSPIITKVVVQKLSDYLDNDTFIKELFKTFLRKHNHPLAQFSLLYQIIELLIEKVYDFEIDKMFMASKNRTFTPNEIKLRIENLAKMDVRIKRLFDDYIYSDLTSTIELQNAILTLLKQFKLEKEPSNHVGENIYLLRNKIVHEFRHIANVDQNFSLLKNINSLFANLVSELVVLFTKHKTDEGEIDDLERLPLEWLRYKSLLEL